jgi:phosphatidylinositol glycan class W
MDDYKSSKEAFVSGMTGSSVSHINMISMVALVRFLHLVAISLEL